MPKKNFTDFINENPTYKSLSGNPDAMGVFDILNRDEQIYDAIRESENGRPALTPSVKLIEDYINSKGNGTVFPLSVPFNRTAVGRMQKTVLIPFGYEPNDKQAACRIGNFKTASCYSRTGKAVMKAVVKIVDIND